MPKEGFSIDDLLNPKPKTYNQESSPTHYAYKNPGSGRKIAQKILKELGITQIPIDLDSISRYLMAQVVFVNNVPGQTQAIGRFMGNGRIEIIKGLPETLFRSTLAHELGHLALLHDIRPRWDTLESLNDSDPHEKEAWDFAGELLLPGPIFKKELKAGANFEKLASLFKVSSELVGVVLTTRRGLL